MVRSRKRTARRRKDAAEWAIWVAILVYAYGATGPALLATRFGAAAALDVLLAVLLAPAANEILGMGGVGRPAAERGLVCAAHDAGR